MDFKCRVTGEDWAALRQSLFTSDRRENAGVLLCGASAGNSTTTLLVRDFVAVPGDQYRTRHSDQLEVSPSYYNSIISRCLRDSLSPILVHSHPGIAKAWYSLADDRGELRLLGVFENLLPSLYPASIVLSEVSATGRRLVNGVFVPLCAIDITGASSQRISPSDTREPGTSNDKYDRQVRAFGIAGQRILEHLKVAVVGVGGVGSLVAEQLVRAGVQDIVLVDHDKVELTNLNRQFGATLESLGRAKVQVAANYLRGLGASDVSEILDSAIRQSVLMRLRDRDVIFACVDNDRTRALLNRFAHQYLIPVIDHGIRLDARDGNISAASGRVTLVGSGLTCLRCSHHLNPDRIRAESLSEAERKTLRKEGYVMGIDEPAPAVVSLNTVIAGLGVTAGLNMFLGLTGGRQPLSQIYDATSGTVFPVQPVHEVNCEICSPLALKGLGDKSIVSAYS